MQIMEAGKDVEKKTEMYMPYNILPLDPAGANQAIMQFPEVGGHGNSIGWVY